MRQSRELKWHEEIFCGIISTAFGIMFLFNGFSYLTSFFLDKNGLHGKPTKQKAIAAFASLLEKGWWKYLIVLIFFLVAFFQIQTGIKNYKGSVLKPEK